MPEVKIGNLDEFEIAASRRIDAGGHALAVVRIGDSIYAVDDICSHAEASLSEGEVYDDDLEIECPLHGSTFDLESGEPSCLPATEPVGTYPVRIDSGAVWVTVP